MNCGACDDYFDLNEINDTFHAEKNVKDLSSCLDTIQKTLSIAQAIPLIGLVFSALKATFSKVQIISSLALCLLFGAATLVTGSRVHRVYFDASTKTAYKGALSFCYSLLNLATIGIFGLLYELSIAGRKVSIVI